MSRREGESHIHIVGFGTVDLEGCFIEAILHHLLVRELLVRDDWLDFQGRRRPPGGVRK